MKRELKFLLALICLLTCSPVTRAGVMAGMASEKALAGATTQVHIADAANLLEFAKAVNSGSDYSAATVCLDNDIDLKGCDFAPIGTKENPFKGTFDGQGHRIKNLIISLKGTYAGFFGCVGGENTVIKNVIIDSSCSITSVSGAGVAGLVGITNSASGATCNITIQNCGNEATVTGNSYVAGLMGNVTFNDNTNITFVNSFNSGTINGGTKSAVICGYARYNYTFTNCYNTGVFNDEDASTNVFFNGETKKGTHKVTNCYDVNYSVQVTTISTTDVNTGVLCRTLNKNRGELAAWTQDLGVDTHPTFGTKDLTYTHTTKKEWETMVLPFDVTLSDSNPFDFYKITSVSGNKLNITRITDSKLAAGTPAIIRIKESAINATKDKYFFSLPVGEIKETITNPTAIGGLTLGGYYNVKDLTNAYQLEGDTFKLAAKASSTPLCSYIIGAQKGAAEKLTLTIEATTTTITDAAALVALASKVNSGTHYNEDAIVLANDIDMSGVAFTPIGKSAAYPFKGTFDGKGHSIKNLTVNRPGDCAGLFGCVAGKNTVIKNVILDSSCSVTAAGGTGVAGLVGSIETITGITCNVTIENCGNGAAVTGGKNVAGIVGGVYNNDSIKLKITNSYNCGAVNGSSESATLCAYARKNIQVVNCYNSGSLTGSDGTHLFCRYDTDKKGGCTGCYDVNGGGSDATAVTAADVRDGYLCYKLTQNKATYKQQLEDDTHPLVGTDGISYIRKTADKWDVIVLPFDVTITDNDKYTFYGVSSVHGSTLNLGKKTGLLRTGNPALICFKESAKNTATGNYELTLKPSGAITSAIDNTDAVDGLTLTGTFLPADLANASGYVYDNGQFVNISTLEKKEAKACQPFRTYLAGTVVDNPAKLTLSTAANSLIISNPTALTALADSVNKGVDYSNCSIYLNKDIDMSGVAFTPIGIDAGHSFKGYFDGRGHRIRNLAVSRSEQGTGLFGTVAGDTTVITHVIIDKSCSFTSTKGKGVAGLVGCVESPVKSCVVIVGCGNEATITGYKNVAGIIGATYTPLNSLIIIKNCYNRGTIKGQSESAAICGNLGLFFSLSSSYNTGSVTGAFDLHKFYYCDGHDITCADCYDINGITWQENRLQVLTQTTKPLTAEQVRSGYLCCMLNGSTTATEWTQDIVNDDYPTFGTAGLHYARTMADQWGAICLPYAVASNDDYTFYDIMEVKDNTIVLAKVNSLAAGRPAIVQRSASATGIDVRSVAGSSFVTTPVAGSTASGLTVTGTFTDKDITGEKGYVIANGSFRNISDANGVPCLPYHAYLAGTLSGGNAAKELAISISSVPTAIDQMQTSDSPLPAAVYDINGRRLSGLQKGVNIMRFSNGETRKVIVR